MLEAARRETGLYDFGPGDFRERLRVMLRSIDEDRDLGALGRLGVFSNVVRYLANRLRFQDLLRRHPEILEVEIERPIVVVGLPRSGTTHLVNLIGADSRLRSLPSWESLEPIPALFRLRPPPASVGDTGGPAAVGPWYPHGRPAAQCPVHRTAARVPRSTTEERTRCRRVRSSLRCSQRCS